MSGGRGWSWALLVIAAALIGGLAAAALVHVSLAVAVAVSVVAGGITAFAATRWPAPADRPGPPIPQQAAPRQAAPRQAAPRQAVSQQEVVQLTPVSLEWWDAAQGAAPPAPSPAAQRAPAPDLSSYLDSTIIAQCPNCGAFRLDFRRARNGWDFRCESCRYIWSWQPGTPWPPVRVAPALRTEQQGTERPRP